MALNRFLKTKSILMINLLKIICGITQLIWWPVSRWFIPFRFFHTRVLYLVSLYSKPAEHDEEVFLHLASCENYFFACWQRATVYRKMFGSVRTLWWCWYSKVLSQEFWIMTILLVLKLSVGDLNIYIWYSCVCSYYRIFWCRSNKVVDEYFSRRQGRSRWPVWRSLQIFSVDHDFDSLSFGV